MSPQDPFNQQDQPSQQQGYSSYETDSQGPSKKTMALALGGGLLLIIILGLLLFSGGQDPSADRLARLSSIVQSQNNIVNLAQRYNKDVTSNDLLNALASAQMNWQSEMNDTLKVHSTSTNPTRQVPPKVKDKLDGDKQAGNLDQNLAIEVLSNLEQIKKDTRSLKTLNPPKELRVQIEEIDKLIEITYDQVSPFAG